LQARFKDLSSLSDRIISLLNRQNKQRNFVGCTSSVLQAVKQVGNRASLLSAMAIRLIKDDFSG